MASHRKAHAPTLLSLSKRQWIRIVAVMAAIILIATAGIASRNFYVGNGRTSKVAESSTSGLSDTTVSRGTTRSDLRGANGDTSYVTVKINGKSRVVLGTKFTTVKSVLDAGNITLEPEDSVSPALTAKVDESTVITISRADTKTEISDTPIAFSVVKKETTDLPQGEEKVQTEGQNGVMETTSLVTRSGSKVVSSNVFTSYVKKQPVDKVILVGTGSAAEAAANTLGDTVPAGEKQQWAHDWLIQNGYTEADFTAANYIINHESGWQTNATNPTSGAYGLPQAYPGNKMASAGADWRTNYQTQFKWFVNYCNQRYGSITAAYAYWVANSNY
ncbi:aggregation-promoting factor C-terminal-like domain-containing protein [Bifidobacterium leontopitheci]|uniref:G5 domain-containing protein n=1 Tax=Bifidobacterium leontopitheci TaxID=2650774 RepID=A0A6I1GFM3_9BIFI|nr:G5 domain-containing protein [Bifidobacterium leontopitheci]KAB7790453.1 G5 domain-containing protein [Bifidobacterium leontopitheci]